MKTMLSHENPAEREPTRMELLAAYAYPLVGAVGIAAYIVSRILD